MPLKALIWNSILQAFLKPERGVNFHHMVLHTKYSVDLTQVLSATFHTK